MKELKCPECGKEFRGEACPICGCPANECSVVEHIETKTENKFSKTSLLPGETIVASAEWEIAPIIVLLFIVSLISWILFGINVGDWGSEIAWTVYFPWALISTILIVVVLVAINFQEFVITNKRVIAYYGFIWRAAFELKMEQVESIIIYQSLLDRLFGCGMVKVCGVGASKAKVYFVKNPFEFRQHFFDLKYAEKNNTLN